MNNVVALNFKGELLLRRYATEKFLEFTKETKPPMRVSITKEVLDNEYFLTASEQHPYLCHVMMQLMKMVRQSYTRSKGSPFVEGSLTRLADQLRIDQKEFEKIIIVLTKLNLFSYHPDENCLELVNPQSYITSSETGNKTLKRCKVHKPVLQAQKSSLELLNDVTALEYQLNEQSFKKLIDIVVNDLNEMQLDEINSFDEQYFYQGFKALNRHYINSRPIQDVDYIVRQHFGNYSLKREGQLLNLKRLRSEKPKTFMGNSLNQVEDWQSGAI